MSQAPPLTIGVPVYNGERYLGEAIDALLGQTYGDFRLIISDNASTDGTEELCRKYESADGRVVYRRNSDNVGAARNYNILVEMADSEFFKWQCADDSCAPTFIQRCMEVLRDDRSVVVAYSKCRIIDKESRPIANVLENYDHPLATYSTRPDVRFRAVAHASHLKYRALEQFGVIRTRELKTTSLVGGYAGADHVLLARLALLGRFHEVPEYLFFYREHPWQSTKTLPDFGRPAASCRVVRPSTQRKGALSGMEAAGAVHRGGARCAPRPGRPDPLLPSGSDTSAGKQELGEAGA
jgi:glycosyltransferase involved in cell wall biosynthesis